MGSMLVFDLNDFCTTFKYNFLQGYHALKILEQAGYIELTEELDNPSRVYFLSKREELYHLKLGDPISDELLQTLLRSYTGLFADFVPIQEEVLAKRLGFTPKEVYERLLHFSRLGVIHYIPRKKSPYVIYQVNREAKERLMLTKMVYEERRDRYQERISAMLNYANDDQVCRNRQLLLYFGEKDGKMCGKCDVCLKKNESGLSNFEFGQIASNVQELLVEGKKSIDQLVDSAGYSAEKIIKVIRFLSDEGKLLVTNEYICENQ